MLSSLVNPHIWGGKFAHGTGLNVHLTRDMSGLDWSTKTVLVGVAGIGSFYMREEQLNGAYRLQNK